METILQLSRRMAHNSSPSHMDMKYSPTDSLKLSNRDNKRIERRKPNWTEAENVFLLDQFGLHREILTCKATDASTNLKKQEIWRLICHNLNTHNTLVRRTPAEVRRKWKNLVTAAKKEVWELRHQMALNGGAPTGRKISELSQRVLQLHSSGGFSNANPNGLYGTLLSAGLISPASVPGAGSDKYGSKYDDEKPYLPAHFAPIITLSESNNNNINFMEGNHSGHSGDGPPSPLSEDDDDESSDSRNAGEFMSDSGTYEQEGIDLRVNISGKNGHGGNLPYRESANHIENGRKDSNHNIHNGDAHDDEDMDDEDGCHARDMSLIRFASQLGLRHKNSINPYLANALLNNGNGKGSEARREYNDRHDRESGSREENLHKRQIQEEDRNGQVSRRPLDNMPEIPHSGLNGELLDATLRMRNHFLSGFKETNNLSRLHRERLELQIDVLKLRKQLLSHQLRERQRHTGPNGIYKKRIRLITESNRKNGLNHFFRLKPKNTWINFASSENNLQEIEAKGEETLDEVQPKVNGVKENDNEVGQGTEEQ